MSGVLQCSMPGHRRQQIREHNLCLYKQSTLLVVTSGSNEKPPEIKEVSLIQINGVAKLLIIRYTNAWRAMK
jgi:hypothetical protein